MNKKELEAQLKAIIEDRDAILACKFRMDKRIADLEKEIKELKNK